MTDVSYLGGKNGILWGLKALKDIIDKVDLRYAMVGRGCDGLQRTTS